MSAISELFGFAIYFFLIIGSVTFFVSAWLSRAKSKRTIYTILAILFLVISIVSFVSSKMAFHKWESEHVGVYYLNEYPNCIDCELELKANKTFIVSEGKKILEKGDWHFEVGGDYFIVYLNGEDDQLGSGRFKYTVSNN